MAGSEEPTREAQELPTGTTPEMVPTSEDITIPMLYSKTLDLELGLSLPDAVVLMYLDRRF